MSPLPAGARWSEAALSLFDASGATAVSAGAGSGKTTALVELSAGCSPGWAGGAARAARRGRHHLHRACRQRAGGPAGTGARRRGPLPAREGGRTRAARLALALRELPSMSVGTIHGYAAALLRLHPLEAGVDPDFAVLDEERAGDLLSAAALQGAMAALDRGDEPSRALARALSGARGVARRRRPWSGTGPPAGSPGPRRGCPGIWRGSIGSGPNSSPRPPIAARAGSATTATGREALAALAARLAAIRGSPRRDDPWDEAERLAELGAATKGWRTGKRDPPERLVARDRLAVAARILPPAAAEIAAAPVAAAMGDLVGEAERRYAEAGRAVRGLDFDGLLTATRDLLAGNPAVLAELRGRLRALLVDEYQDVNGVQQAIFELLTAPREGLPPGPVAVAVGDLKQSIYGFRGADVGVFAGVVERFGAGAGRVLHLTDNHRSTPAVVELVNQVSHQVLQPPPGEAPRPFEIAFGPADRLVARRPAAPARAAELLDDGGPGSGAERRTREAEALAARIEALVSGQAGVPVMERGSDLLERPRRPRYSDVAILFRRTTALGVYERALRAAGVPVRLARGAFHQAPEVRDLGELLASLTDPGDELAWAALLRSPLCAVSDSTLLLLSAASAGLAPRRQPEEARLDGLAHGGGRGRAAPARPVPGGVAVAPAAPGPAAARRPAPPRRGGARSRRGAAAGPDGERAPGQPREGAHAGPELRGAGRHGRRAGGPAAGLAAGRRASRRPTSTPPTR